MTARASESPSGPDDLPEAIQFAAANWLVRHDHGLDAIARAEFDRWLLADERHARAYAQLTDTWGLLDGVPADRVPLPPRRGGRRRWWLVGSLAAAAALVIGTAVFNRGWLLHDSTAVRSATTAVGGFERLALPDGSLVRLNTATELTMDFSRNERRVTLARGEASFDVAKDAARPFIVRVGGVDVRAVGTVFNIRRREGAVDVLVTEGRVRVDDAASGRSLLAKPLTAAPSASVASPVLGAGERATIVLQEKVAPAPAQVATVAPAEAERALAWHQRQLEFSEEPLEQIATEFNRYNREKLVIADPELAAQRFGGKFPADDFQSLVRLLETNFGVSVERRGNETVLRRGPGVR